MIRARLVLLLAPLLPTPIAVDAVAQEAPRDDAIFGAPDTAPNEAPTPKTVEQAPPSGDEPRSVQERRSEEEQAPGRSTAPPAAAAADARDEAILGDDGPTRLSEETAPEDPLRVGGQFYLRAVSSALEGRPIEEVALSSPSLLDVYLDARPNERVRGFVLGRMSYDPTLPAAGADPGAGLGPMETSGATMGSAPLSSLSRGRTRGPRVALDQLWLRFDLKRTVFVTAGKQHVRWGTARFWTPTDYLHVFRRNPLDVFDARTGTTMLKLHLPWEARGWNFYGYALTEQPEATPRASQIAVAARAEIVLASTEVGLGGFFQKGSKPKLAVDVSTGIGEVDLYGEVAIRHRGDVDRVRYDANAPAPPATERPTWVSPGEHRRAEAQRAAEAFFPRLRRDDWRAQVVGGATYQRKYNDNDVFTFGAECFYNPLGYGHPSAYLGLVVDRPRPLRDPATFFYLGRHYGALFLNVPAPYSWNYTTFTLSTLANLSDRSFITRIDYSLLLLTHLRFEAYAAVRYGETSGEFRFGLRGFTLPGYGTFDQAPALLDLGVALRVSL